jgi:hypothetical protein
MPAGRRWLGRSAGCALAACLLEAVTPGCSLGEGTGYVTGTLNVPLCWTGSFNLNPNFFAAVPYLTSLDIRIQNGGDYETFSDAVLILVDNVDAVLGVPPYASEIGKELTLSLPPGVVPPGDPVLPDPNPASVHLTLSLNKSCQTEEIALYALDKVSLNADGSCDQLEAGPLTIQCDGANMGLVDAGSSDAGEAEAAAPPTASSWIEFDDLFDGNPYETSAVKRLTKGTFHAYLGDPREGCPGGVGPPPPCRGHLTGEFSFYFERGQPAQPFQ